MLLITTHLYNLYIILSVRFRNAIFFTYTIVHIAQQIKKQKIPIFLCFKNLEKRKTLFTKFFYKDCKKTQGLDGLLFVEIMLK